MSLHGGSSLVHKEFLESKSKIKIWQTGEEKKTGNNKSCDTNTQARTKKMHFWPTNWPVSSRTPDWDELAELSAEQEHCGLRLLKIKEPTEKSIWIQIWYFRNISGASVACEACKMWFKNLPRSLFVFWNSFVFNTLAYCKHTNSTFGLHDTVSIHNSWTKTR